jgi:hypothetical protein
MSSHLHQWLSSCHPHGCIRRAGSPLSDQTASVTLQPRYWEEHHSSACLDFAQRVPGHAFVHSPLPPSHRTGAVALRMQGARQRGNAAPSIPSQDRQAREAGGTQPSQLRRPVRATNEGADKRRILNHTETAAVKRLRSCSRNASARKHGKDFNAPPGLIGEDNRCFNSIVLGDCSTEGDSLTLPYMAKDFAPRQHQRAGVARMLSVAAGGLLLGHIEKRILGQEVPLWPRDLARGIAREQNRGFRKSMDPHLVPQQGGFICS